MTSPQPTPYYFTACDNTAFQSLLEEHILGFRNTLIGTKPSEINFTANCWATLDLQHFTFNGSTIDEISRLSYIDNGLRPALPYVNTSTGIVDTNEYWSAIVILNSTEGVMNEAIKQCNNLDGFFIPPLDFTTNCSATADFWWHNVFNTTTPRQSPPDPSWLPLFKSSLVEPYQNMSGLTITAIYEKARVDNLTLSNVLPNALQKALVTAAVSCALPACLNLGYSGDADIAGTGAIIAYGFIAGVSTLLMTTVAYFNTNIKNVNDELRKSLFTAAITFWDTVLWFGVLGCIAGLVYATLKAQSLYEFVISLLVVNLICNSMFLLLGLYSDRVERMDESINIATRFLPQAFVFACMLVVTLMVDTTGAENLWGKIYTWNHYDFIDMPCYAGSRWPMFYLKVALKLQQFLLLSPFAFALLCWIVERTFMIPYLGKTSLFRKLQACFLLLKIYELENLIIFFVAATLWVDFGFIVHIRARARTNFGATFEDDAFGYGQIISAGIAAQAIYAYIWAVSEYLLRPSKDNAASTQHDPQSQLTNLNHTRNLATAVNPVQHQSQSPSPAVQNVSTAALP